MSGQGMTYVASGVNIDAGNLFAQMVRQRVATAWPDCAGEIGGFAGGGDIPEGAKTFKSSTDGTGTKAILAAMTRKLDGIGQDAVAMSAVDTFMAGHQPAFLLDSLDVAVLEPEFHIQIIDSIISGCVSAGCCLIGGETAELPDMFRHDWMFNLNTMVIGFPDPRLTLCPVKPGQLVYGWESRGPASNGFSLIRRVFGLKDRPSRARKRLERRWSELGGETLADVLLRPTPIYNVRIQNHADPQLRGVRFCAHAHITGGGMVENIPRILPDDCKVVIDRSKWVRPSIFPLIQRLGNVPNDDMDRTFNQGVMVVSIVAPDGPELSDPNAHLIGEVMAREGDEPQVELTGKFQDEG